MAKPVLLTIDDDPEVLRAVERDLRKRYSDRYRVMRADSGATALQTLQTLKRVSNGPEADIDPFLSLASIESPARHRDRSLWIERTRSAVPRQAFARLMSSAGSSGRITMRTAATSLSRPKTPSSPRVSVPNLSRPCRTFRPVDIQLQRRMVTC